MAVDVVAPSCPICHAPAVRDPEGFWKCSSVCHWRSFADRATPVAGVRCPNADCGSPFHRTLNTVPKTNNQIVRYRQCEHCGRRFKTVEQVARGC